MYYFTLQRSDLDRHSAIHSRGSRSQSVSSATSDDPTRGTKGTHTTNEPSSLVIESVVSLNAPCMNDFPSTGCHSNPVTPVVVQPDDLIPDSINLPARLLTHSSHVTMATELEPMVIQSEVAPSNGQSVDISSRPAGRANTTSLITVLLI